MTTQRLHWSFGLSPSLPVHNVSQDDKKVNSNWTHIITSYVVQMIFYSNAHTGILYDCTNHKQILLQGHVSERGGREGRGL